METATSINQSKKLIELGIDVNSADMHWQYIEEDNGQLQWFYFPKDFSINENESIPAWSLSALLGVLPYHLIVNNTRYEFSMYKGLNQYGETYMIIYNSYYIDICLYKTEYYNNPIDAAFEMVCYLLENKLIK